MRDRYDVVIIGGGPGGVCAAVGAAQEGASVLLVERYGFLGGMATAGLVNPFMSYRAGGKKLTSAVFNELLDRLEQASALDRDGQVFDDEGMKIVLDRMMQDHGVDLLLHSTLVGVEMAAGKPLIAAAQTVGKSGRLDVRGTVFVDSTGDGDLAALAGAPCEKGRKQDGFCQPMTLCFRIGGVAGEPTLAQLRRELTEIYLTAKAAGEVSNPREDILIFATTVPHIFHFNTTRVIQRDATSTLDMTAAELEGRRQTAELVDLFRRKSPRFKDAYLIKTAAQIGVRESRRVMGQYVLDVDDVLEAAKFADGIARSNYPVDIHSPTGEGTVIQHLPPGEFYEIPYRCLVPPGVDNLLIGARCISSTHEAHSSLRVMPVVAGIGEAAGIAAAWAVREGVPPKDIDGTKLKKRVLE
ncbi:MAG: FAD-dependent oxidoreductase [Anaerolineae bacterium]|nr:FAD-dependent oxidoreductase [Anaerolineae bacterium]